MSDEVHWPTDAELNRQEAAIDWSKADALGDARMTTIAIEDIEAFLDYVLGLERACEYVASQDWLDTPLGVSEAVLRCAEALESK